MRLGIDLRSLQSQPWSGIGYYTDQLTHFLAPANDLFFFLNQSSPVNLPSWYAEHGTIEQNYMPSKAFNMSTRVFARPYIHGTVRPDLLWLPSHNFTSWAKDIPAVLTIHDLSWLINPHWYNWRRRAWHYLLNFSRLLHKASHLVAVSQSTKRDLIDLLSVPDEKISVIHSGLEFDYQKKWAPSKDAPDKYFVFVATWEPRKNIVSIVLAWQRLRRQRQTKQSLVLIGVPGWGGLAKWLHQQAVDSQGALQLRTAVDEHTKYSLLANSSALLWPSFYEGFGYPPLEALLLGRPVITSNGSSIGEIVGNHAIMINPYNINELAAAMLLVEENKVVGPSPAEIDKIASYFSWQRAVDQYNELFSRLLHEQK